MHILFAITPHNKLRLEEIAGALTAIAGGLLFVGAGTPFGRRAGQLSGGVCLAAAGVIAVVALHWGR